MAARSNEETRIRVETAKDNMPQHIKENIPKQTLLRDIAAKPQPVEKVVETNTIATIDKKIIKKEQLVPVWLKEFRNVAAERFSLINKGHSDQTFIRK